MVLWSLLRCIDPGWRSGPPDRRRASLYLTQSKVLDDLPCLPAIALDSLLPPQYVLKTYWQFIGFSCRVSGLSSDTLETWNLTTLWDNGSFRRQSHWTMTVPENKYLWSKFNRFCLDWKAVMMEYGKGQNCQYFIQPCQKTIQNKSPSGTDGSLHQGAVVGWGK